MWKLIVLVVLLACLVVVVASYWPGKGSKPKLTAPDEPHVLLVIADSLMTQPLQSLMEQGELPGFSFLYENGFMSELTSVFPTMSVVNDSSILTGAYPDEHGIPGLVWFDRGTDTIVDYGDAMGNITRKGPLNVAKSTMVHLNEQHLSENVETIHEYLAKRNIPSGSINLMVRRGSFKHELRFPFNRLLGEQYVCGPSSLHCGFFLKNKRAPIPTPLNKYGYGYDEVEQMTLKLMNEPSAPRLLITYLSEPDKVIHKKGPTVKKPLYDIDRFIQHILDAFPTREEALRNWRIVVIGDSGQAPVYHDKARALISMPDLLSQYTLRGVSKPPEEADLAVATNERMAYLYPLDDELKLTQLAERVLADERVDLVAYADNARTHVHTAKGILRFQRGGTRTDPYGQAWDVDGDPSLLDVKVHQDRWEYGEYVDVFRQLHGAVHAQPSPVVVITAKPGFEFKFESSPTHVGGGSHGGISKQEMTIPIIVGGTTEKPKHNRLVDLKQYLIDCLQLNNDNGT